MSIEVLRPGLLTSIQDLGRWGYQKHGVIVSGAMDAHSLKVANLLVGNLVGESGLEMTLLGSVLKVAKGTLLAITGGDLTPTADDLPLPMWRPVYITKDCVLKFGLAKSGCRAYLAIAGGFDVPKVMGSKSTYLRAGLGGWQGRALQAGDVISSRIGVTEPPSMLQRSGKFQAASFITTEWYAGKDRLNLEDKTICLRFMRGRQYAWFTSGSIDAFHNQSYTVTPQSDRMGYRLLGQPLTLTQPQEMISEAVTVGSVQIPPAGQPIVLLADRQTAGGYPKIAQVAAVDIPLIAQAKPGSKIKFQEISLAEAEQLYLEQERYLELLRRAIELKFKGLRS